MRMATMAALVLGLAVAACDGSAVLTGPNGELVGVPGPSGTGGTNATASLVGTWRRSILFFDFDGSAASSETTWRFDSGGTGSRSVIARNFTSGVADALISTLTWQATSTTVQVTFVTPQTGTVSYDWSVRGDTLVLAGQGYLRVR